MNKIDTKVKPKGIGKAGAIMCIVFASFLLLVSVILIVFGIWGMVDSESLEALLEEWYGTGYDFYYDLSFVITLILGIIFTALGVLSIVFNSLFLASGKYKIVSGIFGLLTTIIGGILVLVYTEDNKSINVGNFTDVEKPEE